ncbi:MAG: SPOR domain-containing protein [candidate division Zixibacteria bacterium]|nr:SPOR domain-containing protein [candidate division Zixibacteria bacterium]
MKKLISICSLLTLGFGFVLFSGCSRPQKPSDETQEADSGDRGYRFDPLDLSQDLEIVPQKDPQSGEIGGQLNTVNYEAPTDYTATDRAVGLPDAIDTLNHQAYRVQLFTSKLYGEARQALRVAQEIFDRPVFLDYEVPYFKVRVGSFSNREDGEDYQQRAKAAGYPEAWVVMVNVGVREPAPLYPEGTPPALEDSVMYEEGFGPHD